MSVRQFARRTTPVHAAVEGIVTTVLEVPGIAHMNYTIEDAPVANLNPEQRTDENRKSFLAYGQVNEFSMNLLVYTGSHVSIFNYTAFRK